MHMQNLTGQLLGQYELREILGFGGMGVAYRAHQKTLERDVAVKVLMPGLASESGYIERFHREAKTASALEHAHIVPVYDYGVQGDISYVVMRLLPGGSLDDRMAQRTRNESELPSLGEVAKLLEQLASALDYAHGRGVVHRDIKPANIMFDEQGIAYVVDFGIAKLLESTTAFTATGTPVGTPMYMPPEQWKSESLTPAADQYALAVTIYHLMTGKLPFEATTPYGMLHKHLNEDPTPPETYRPDIPAGVRRAIQQAMQKRPAERYKTTGAFAEAFREAVGAQTGVGQTGFFTMPVLSTKAPASGTINVQISPTGPTAMTQTITEPVYKSPLFWVVAAAAVIAIALLIFLLATQNSDDAPPETLSAALLQQTVDVQSSAQAAEFEHTIEALHATATEIGRRNRNAIATQNAVALVATTRAEPTQTAIAQAATMDAWTKTPTSTPTPTATPEPTATPTEIPTATPSPTPAGPAPGFAPPSPQPLPPDGPVMALRAVYDDGQFVLINNSTIPADLRGVVFEQQNREGEVVRVFFAREWIDRTNLTGTLDAGACVQFVTATATHVVPERDVCPNGLRGWLRSGATNEYFWLGDTGADTFTVRMDFMAEPFMTCVIADGECEFQLPAPPQGQGPGTGPGQ